MPVHEPEPARALDARAARLRLLLFDVDGVLTDGTILLHADGTESKAFSIRDGTAFVFAQRAGLLTGLLSARPSAATTHRAAQLAIPIVQQGAHDKLAVYEQLLTDHGLGDAEVAFMGDDVIDLPVIGRVGLSACPADAAAEVRERVDWVSPSPGGRGAVRDFVEMVLRARGDWERVLRLYLEGPAR
jgi:3-deoxy-D-manno-octulosonate 8-phosphate phosphatase (KDO 8-P phosphatase)